MRNLWVVPILLALLLSGCIVAPADEPTDDAGAPASAEETQAAPEDVEETVAALAGAFVAALGNTTLDAGVDFNVTLEYEGDDADAGNLSWSISFTAVADNATDDNATDANATAPEALTLDGTGLPATVTLNLTAGNFTLTGSATDGASSVDLAETALTIVAVDLAPSDPCEGVAPPESITLTGLFAGAAVDGTGTYQGVPFALEGACVTKMEFEITSSEAYLDPMLRLKDTSGATVDSEDNEFLYHDTLTYEPGGYLEEGNWQIDARGYAAGPGNYEIIITFS